MWRRSSSSSTRCTTSVGTERRFAVFLGLALTLVGCAAAPAASSTPSGAKPPPVSKACRLAVRDVAYYCRPSLVQEDPESRYDCLAARLDVSRLCYPAPARR